MAKTVRSGIPDAQGMRMPAFGAILKDDEVAAVVAFARSLMPAEALREGASAAEMELVVGDEAQVVRGALPPLHAGDPVTVRGLLVGLPGGATFQYDTQEYALLAVRHGAFVSRSDWVERGGRPLTPLGDVVWQAPPAARRPLFDGVSLDGWRAGGEGDVIVRLRGSGESSRGIRLPLVQSGDPERARTGSVTPLRTETIAAPVRAALVQDEVWYELAVRLETRGAVTRVELWVNGVRVNTVEVPADGPGAIELRHGSGAPLWFRRIEVRHR